MCIRKVISFRHVEDELGDCSFSKKDRVFTLEMATNPCTAGVKSIKSKSIRVGRVGS